MHDLWGQTSIIRSQVVASNFGWALALGSNTLEEVGESTETRKISFKRIEMIVAYSEGGNENQICFAGRAIEFSDDGVRREHVTDDVWGILCRRASCSTRPRQDRRASWVRVLIIPTVGDLAERADSASVSPSVKAYQRAAYLFATEAAE